jgi:outer membrane protein OmpA-like peptidoglycan-associated protein/tetratricopeptide (TPR) repeat protein
MVGIRKIFFLLSFVFAMQYATAQRSDRILQRAGLAYENLEYYNAASLYERYYKSDSSDEKVLLRLADCYWNMRQYDLARAWYSKVSKNALLVNDTLTKRFAELSAMAGDYQLAGEVLSKLKKYQTRVQGFSQRNRFLKDSADWNVQYLNINTQRYREFSPMLLGTSIIWSTNEPKKKNAEDIFGWDANGFVRQKFLANQADLGVRDVPNGKVALDSIKKSKEKSIARTYSAADVSIRTKGYVSNSFLRTRKLRMNQPQDLKIFKKLQYNVGHATASAAASKMYLTVNRQDKISDNAIRSLGIVEADIMGSYIANPVFVPISSVNEVDSNEVILHGAIDPMGKYLVFSSNRAGGKGGYDLYASIRSLDGKWSAPEALESLNSAGDEVFSAFSSNGDLYFSSNGRAGLGGLDIYKVKTRIAPFSMALLFEDPEHLSYPVNSDHDDFGLVLSENSQKGYFTSDRNGSDDIFSFVFNKQYISISGSVIDRGTNLRAQYISVSLYEVAEDGKIKIVDSVETDKNGVYTFSSARPNKEYVIKVYEPINEDGVQNVTVVKSSTEPDGIERGLAVATVEFTKPASSNGGMSIASIANITEAEKVTKDQAVAVNSSTPTVINQPIASLNKKSTPELSSIGNGFKEPVPSDSFYAIVYFGFDLDNITIRAVRTLDSVVAYMKANPQDEFILLGHADEVGDIQYNIDLSKRRVIQVIRYIGSKGVDTKRLKLSYYGENRPAQTNNTSRNYLQMNRRVEFMLIKH